MYDDMVVEFNDCFLGIMCVSSTSPSASLFNEIVNDNTALPVSIHICNKCFTEHFAGFDKLTRAKKKQTSRRNKRMKMHCSLLFDRISDLPSNISEIILMFLPLRDMARTSILSKNWRYQWLKVPQLLFNDDPNTHVSEQERYRYTAKAVFEILLLHRGPILTFTLDMTTWSNCSEVDSIIPFLSRNGIQELTLLMPKQNTSYKLLSSLLSCVELRRLSLSSCVFEPLTLVGFSKLMSLELTNVGLESDVSISSCPLLKSLVLLDILTTVNLFSIDAPNLNKLHFKGNVTRIGIMNTPLLIVLSLVGEDECYSGNSSFDLINFLHSMPLLEDLCLCYGFLQVLAGDDAPNKLPKLLNNLKILDLFDVDLSDLRECSSFLWFIRSSPNLQTLHLELCKPVTSLIEAEQLYFKMQDYSHYSLSKLQEVEIILTNTSRDLSHVIEFSKFLLNISPVLETLRIEPDLELIAVNGYKKLVELACSPRASPKAKIVYSGLHFLNLTIT